MESRFRGEKRSLQSVAGSPSQADRAVRWKHPCGVFRFAERQRYSLCREDLSQLLQARLPSCRPFELGVLWFRVVLRDLHKFDVNASNLKWPAKVAARKGKSIWAQLRSDAEYSWLNLRWSVENTTQNAQRIHQWDGEAESTPAGNATELNQALKGVEEKVIEKSFHCYYCYVVCCYWKVLEWNVFRVGWREEWNCLERKLCECDFGFSLILEWMECGEDWKWNNVSVNVESSYST